ncbi:MAG TPA: LamG domain-containing protein [Kofleriaceae bacterium]|nr:LamG domain-containing protein [Kofleriaceae bacterium]
MNALATASMIACAIIVAGCGEVRSQMSADAAVGSSDTPVESDAADPSHDATDPGHDAAPDAAPACITTPASLLARWRAEQNANDSGGNYNGTPQGGPAYATGHIGTAFVFDAVDDAVTIPDGDVMFSTGSFSVEAWFKPDLAGTIAVSKYDCGGICGSGSNALWELDVASDGKARFELRADATSTIESVSGGPSIVDNHWHHIVGVRNVSAAALQLFVDGSLAMQMTLPANQLGALSDIDHSSDPTVIGARYTGGANTLYGYYGGAIDEVAYYTDALTTSYIADVYASPTGICP